LQKTEHREIEIENHELPAPVQPLLCCQPIDIQHECRWQTHEGGIVHHRLHDNEEPIETATEDPEVEPNRSMPRNSSDRQHYERAQKNGKNNPNQRSSLKLLDLGGKAKREQQKSGQDRIEEPRAV
jgi:hypothetical protein